MWVIDGKCFCFVLFCSVVLFVFGTCSWIKTCQFNVVQEKQFHLLLPWQLSFILSTDWNIWVHASRRKNELTYPLVKKDFFVPEFIISLRKSCIIEENHKMSNSFYMKLFSTEPLKGLREKKIKMKCFSCAHSPLVPLEAQ